MPVKLLIVHIFFILQRYVLVRSIVTRLKGSLGEGMEGALRWGFGIMTFG